MSKRAHSLQDKIKIIEALNNRSHTLSELAFIYQVCRDTIYNWVYRYEKYGVEGLNETSTWKKYSKELKLAAVQDYLSSDYSYNEVSRKYEISSTSLLRK